MNNDSEFEPNGGVWSYFELKVYRGEIKKNDPFFLNTLLISGMEKAKKIDREKIFG